jgi:hypothetical protein
MSNLSKSETTKQTEKFGPDFELAKALFEKIQQISEDIGKKKVEPFNIRTVEQVRAMYKENEQLFKQLTEALVK